MRIQLVLSLLGLFAVTASAVATQKAVIVSYPDDTPDSVVNQAIDAVREAVSWRASGSWFPGRADFTYRVAPLHTNTVGPLPIEFVKVSLTKSCAELFK